MLIVAALTIILGATVVAINPAKQLADARNGQRKLDVALLWNALHQYALDHHGSYPPAVQFEGTLEDCLAMPLDDSLTVCESGCSVTLPELLDSGKYLLSLPSDPSLEDASYTGYNVFFDTEHNDRISVCAPGAENEEVIYLPQQ
jgi:hypothetical protein